MPVLLAELILKVVTKKTDRGNKNEASGFAGEYNRMSGTYGADNNRT